MKVFAVTITDHIQWQQEFWGRGTFGWLWKQTDITLLRSAYHAKNMITSLT